MTNSVVSAADLEALRALNSPTISNAIERLRIRPRGEGFTDCSIRCMFPEMGAIVGYACTATMRAAEPLNNGAFDVRKAYWDCLSKHPAPRIAVIQDLDDPPVGALWGEVNANIHRALGCVGVITNGTVRDLDEVRALGFQFFASDVSVSHVWAHLESFGNPLKVCGFTVSPGDLIHADKHGAIIIPTDRVKDILEAATAVEKYERPIINLCKSAEFSIEKLEKLIKG